MNQGLVEATPASTVSNTDRKGSATMADKTTAQTTIDAALRHFGPLAASEASRKKKRGNGFPGAARVERKVLPRNQATFRAAPRRPLRIPGRG